MNRNMISKRLFNDAHFENSVYSGCTYFAQIQKWHNWYNSELLLAKNYKPTNYGFKIRIKLHFTNCN